MDLAARVREEASDGGVPFSEHHDTRSDGEDVAAERRKLLVRHGEQPDPLFLQQLVQARRQHRQVDHGEVVGHGRDDRQEMQALGRSVAIGHVEHLDPPADDVGQLGRARSVRPKRPTDAEQVGPKPERVAAIHGARGIDAPDGRDPVSGRPGLECGFLAQAIRLAGPERDRAAVGHEQGIERVDEVGRAGLGLELVDPDTELGQEVGERVVLSTGELEVDRGPEAVVGVGECVAERRPRALDQHIVQGCRHRLGTEPREWRSLSLVHHRDTVTRTMATA